MDIQRPIDELLIRVTGRTPIERKLTLGQDIELTLHGSIVKELVEDNCDGTVTVCYVFKAMTAEAKT